MDEESICTSNRFDLIRKIFKVTLMWPDNIVENVTKSAQKIAETNGELNFR